MSATIINKMLVRAVYENDINRVKELILMGADPNYSYRRNGKPSNLLKACMQLELIEMLKVLLENGANFHSSEKNNLIGRSNFNKRELICFLESNEQGQAKELTTNKILDY